VTGVERAMKNLEAALERHDPVASNLAERIGISLWLLARLQHNAPKLSDISPALRIAIMRGIARYRLDADRLLEAKVVRGKRVMLPVREYENAAIVVELVAQLRGAGNWCGRPHLQKAAYFLKHLTGVPLDFDFILYKHGPFSFGLRSELSYLQAVGLLERRLNEPPYAPSLQPGPRAHLLMQRYRAAAEQYDREIGFIAEQLADKGVVALEKLGTALWVTLNTEATTDQDRADTMVELKPHIGPDEALEAVHEVDRMREEYERECLGCSH